MHNLNSVLDSLRLVKDREIERGRERGESLREEGEIEREREERERIHICKFGSSQFHASQRGAELGREREGER